MSGKNLELSLVMRLRDLASSAFTRSQRDIQSGIAKTEKATGGLTRTVVNLGKVRSAAEVLGLRTEQNIQREIQRTEAAYNRLARSGSMSMREQARAAEVARNKVRELNNEMGKFTLAQKTARGLQTGAMVAGGAAAAGYVLSKPIGQTMDYGMRLAQMSNTAFNERDTIGRVAGKRELNAAIVNATRIGGGTRESTAETLDTLIASGAMSGKDAMGMLPTLTKAATASGADSSQLAQIGIRGMQTFGIKSGEMGKVIDMAITAGQAGGFELKDMAKWLPQQMAAAKLSGISGTAGMAKLLAANQASAITAGTKDEAGNNLVNLLTKINSQDTAKDAQRLGINLSGTLSAARAKGIDGLDAFVGIADHVVGKDKNYQALQEKLKSATGAERKSVLESQADILQGSAIGQIVQDRQALMALVGIMSNRDYMADVQKKALAGEGAADKNFAVISQEAGFKTQQAANEKIFATQNAFENLTPLIGSVADGFASIAQEYPNLTAATVAATTALAALAAAAGAAGLVSLIGGGKGGGILETILTKTKGAPAALGRGALAAGTALGSAAGLAVAGAAATGGLIGTGIYHGAVKGSEYEDRIGGMIATILAGWGNQEAKQALEVNLHLDGEQIATVVNRRNASTARRN
jgi:hypothetical protein